MNRARKHDRPQEQAVGPAKPFVLKKTAQIGEDEADAIVSLRRITEESVTLREYLRKRGHALDR